MRQNWWSFCDDRFRHWPGARNEWNMEFIAENPTERAIGEFGNVSGLADALARAEPTPRCRFSGQHIEVSTRSLCDNLIPFAVIYYRRRLPLGWQTRIHIFGHASPSLRKRTAKSKIHPKYGQPRQHDDCSRVARPVSAEFRNAAKCSPCVGALLACYNSYFHIVCHTSVCICDKDAF